MRCAQSLHALSDILLQAGKPSGSAVIPDHKKMGTDLLED